MELDLTKWKPPAGCIFGEVLDGQDYVSKGGIHIVGSLRRKKPSKVRVISVGRPFNDEKGRPQQYCVQPGQIAFFKLSQGAKITINRKLHLLLENRDIVAVEAGD